jgi:hypothetical protein
MGSNLFPLPLSYKHSLNPDSSSFFLTCSYVFLLIQMMDVVNGSTDPKIRPPQEYQRMNIPMKSLMSPFFLRQQQFSHQFSNIYRLRISKLRPYLRSQDHIPLSIL